MKASERCYGFSLVELMVSLAISLFLILGIFQIYISANNTDRTGQALAKVQGNGRFALSYLMRDLRLTGYQGCIDLDTMAVSVVAKDDDINVDIIPLQGFVVDASGNWSPAKPAEDDELDIDGAPANASDVIYIQHASPIFTEVTCPGDVCAKGSALPIDDLDDDISKGDMVIVTDCDSADMFRVTNDPTSQSPGNYSLAHSGSAWNKTSDLSIDYEETVSKQVRVMTFKANAYYVKDTGRDSSSGDDIFALFRYDRQKKAEFEIVEGIERLKVLYGEELSSGNLRFVSADDANLDMDNVKAIRISVLAVSNERVKKFDDKVNYNLVGTTVQPSTVSGAAITYAQDRRLRRAFTATIQLRN